MTKLFSLHGSNDIRGEACIRLDLSGDTEIKKKLRQAVLKNLGTNEDSIKNIKDVIVARHHWTLNQLHYFFGQGIKHRILTPMPYQDIIKIAHAVERTMCTKRRGKDYFYNLPNHPFALIRKDAISLDKDTHDSER